MPWKERHVGDERVRFVRRVLDGEPMTALCEEFALSRKTGCKSFRRYQQIGVRGLSDRSRRPYRHANQLPGAVEALIVRLKKDYPTWGAPKIRAAAPALARHPVSGHQHGARRARSPRPGDAPSTPPPAAPHRHTAYVERVIGSIGRECLDYVSVFNRAGLRRLLTQYVAYYVRLARTWRSQKDCPVSRAVHPPFERRIVATP